MSEIHPRKTRRGEIQIRRSRRSAFTLIEMLVVIGIVVLLAGLLLPMALKAFRSGSRARVAADLASIQIGLDAFKGDFGTYPKVDVPGTGFAVLGKSMIGPYGDGVTGTLRDTLDPPDYDAGKAYKPGDCVFDANKTFVALVENTGQPTSAATYWAEFDVHDAQDGPGFKTRGQGKTYGPYLASGKFKTRGAAILDHFGNPILYFPASPSRLNLSVPGTFYVSSPNGGLVPGGGISMFKFDDNGFTAISLTAEQDQTRPYLALARMQAMMGAATNIATSGSARGNLANGEQPASTAGFVLWSCGPDGKFGPFGDITQYSDVKDRIKAARDCDDVTSFKQ